MPGLDHRLSAVTIEVALARAGVEPDVLAALDHKWNLLVSSYLVLLFEVDQVFDLWLCDQIYSPECRAPAPRCNPLLLFKPRQVYRLVVGKVTYEFLRPGRGERNGLL